MITVREARDRAEQRLRRAMTTWATSIVPVPAMTIALHPPTERVARVDASAAESWVREWDAAELPAGVSVEWETRAWRSIGRQRVPVRLRLQDPSAVASFARGETSRRWRTLTGRVSRVRDALGESDEITATIRRHGATLTDVSPERFNQILAASAWLLHNDVEGMRPRQLPIRSVDSKWFGANRGLVSALVLAAGGREALGIVASDPLVRVRVLDPDLVPGGVSDFAASREQLRGLGPGQRVTFVFENLESVLAMPPWPGAVVVHGSGYAVDVIGELPWVRTAPVIYWGDLDSDGFAILHRLRSHLPEVQSVLMDEQTLLAHRDLWVSDPTPATGSLTNLTRDEGTARDRLIREGHARLEQERIPWDTALAALRRAASAVGA